MEVPCWGIVRKRSVGHSPQAKVMPPTHDIGMQHLRSLKVSTYWQQQILLDRMETAATKVHANVISAIMVRAVSIHSPVKGWSWRSIHVKKAF
eukprot:scaffold3092_cov153-Skeletonema_marinoi.AAC.20